MKKLTFNWFKWYDRKVRIICHIVFWFFFSLFYYLNYNRLAGPDTWLFTVKDWVIVFPLFYFTVPLLVDKGILGGKYYIIPIWTVFAYAWWATVNYFTCKLSLQLYPNPDERWRYYLEFVTENGIAGMFRLPNLDVFVFDFIFMVYLPIGPKLMKSLMESGYKNVLLENANLSLEVKFLKSQITPHFLFNTLNNIYIMAKRFDQETPEMILKLSGLMRYILYESDSNRIALSRETAFLSDYVQLNRLKYGDTIRIDYDVENVDKPYKIAPLILVPFVENAFKHGPEVHPDNNWIQIKAWMENNVFHMEISNAAIIPEPDENGGRIFGGVGLENATKRLKYYYPEKHEITTWRENGSYHVKLKIDLK